MKRCAECEEAPAWGWSYKAFRAPANGAIVLVRMHAGWLKITWQFWYKPRPDVPSYRVTTRVRVPSLATGCEDVGKGREWIRLKVGAIVARLVERIFGPSDPQ